VWFSVLRSCLPLRSTLLFASPFYAPGCLSVHLSRIVFLAVSRLTYCVLTISPIAHKTSSSPPHQSHIKLPPHRPTNHTSNFLLTASPITHQTSSSPPHQSHIRLPPHRLTNHTSNFLLTAPPITHQTSSSPPHQSHIKLPPHRLTNHTLDLLLTASPITH
jgi:hypothetical protein